MAEMRGCDLVVEYLIKEKVPYLFGYAGHGAVGLLDGVYNRQDEIKIIFPRIESARRLHGRRVLPRLRPGDPRLHVDGPRPDAADRRDGRTRSTTRPRSSRSPGQVATNQYDSGALQEEYRHYQADFPSIAKVITKRSFQAQSVEDLGKFLPKAFKLARTGRPGPGAHRRPVRPLDPHRRRRGARARRSARSMLNWRTPGSPEAVAPRARDAAEGEAAADPRRRRRDLLGRDRAARRRSPST